MGDTTGSTTPQDTVLQLLGVQLETASVSFGTLNATFTTDFSAQTATAHINITFLDGSQLAYEGSVGNWQNTAVGTLRTVQSATATV